VAPHWMMLTHNLKCNEAIRNKIQNIFDHISNSSECITPTECSQLFRDIMPCSPLKVMSPLFSESKTKPAKEPE
jgi:hypothetical protein